MAGGIASPKVKRVLGQSAEFKRIQAYLSTLPKIDPKTFGALTKEQSKIINSAVNYHPKAPKVTSVDTGENGWGYDFTDLKNSPYGKLERSGAIDRYTGKLKKGKRYEDLTPEVQKLYDSVERINSDITDLGGKPVGNKGTFLTKVFDYLSRGNYAVAQGARRADESKKADKSDADITFGQFKGFARGFTEGLRGKKKTHFSEVLAEQKGHKNDARSKVLGFAMDIALDPTTYLGVGAVSKVAKGADVAGQIARTEHAANEISKLKVASYDVDKAKQLLGRELIGKVVSKDVAAKVTRSADGLIRDASKAAAKAHANEVFQREHQVLVGAGKTKSVATRKARALATSEELVHEKNYAATLAEIVAKNTDPEIKKAIQVKLAGVKIATSPEFATRAVQRLASADRSVKVLTTFNKHLSTSYKRNKMVHEAGLAAAGNSQRLIRHHVNRVKRAFSGIDEVSQRNDITERFIQKAPVPTLNRTGQDAQDFFETDLRRIAGFLDPAIGEVTVKDLNRWLPDNQQLVLPGTKKGKKPPINDPIEIFRHSFKTWGNKDSGDVLWKLNIALAQSLNQRALIHSMREEFGVSLQHAGADALTKEHGFRTLSGHPIFEHVEGYAFHPEIADSVEKMLLAMSDHHKVGDIAKGIDKIQRPWKTAVTTYNPGFWTRNSLGDAFVAWMNGVNSPVPYQKAWKVLRSLKLITEDSDVDKALLAVNPIEATRNLGPQGKQVIRNKWAKGKDDKYLSVEQIWAAYNENGLKQGFMSTEFEKVVGGNKNRLGHTATKINEGVGKWSERREDLFRLGHFIDVLSKSNAPTFEKAAQEAAAAVRKFHFDYTDFTHTEKAVLNRAIPFYKWQRKALPLMAELLFAQPGKASSVPKALRLLSELRGYNTDNELLPSADEVLPDYLRGSLAVPLFESAAGNTTYLRPSLPMSDILGQSNIRSMAASTTPLARIPYEELHKRQTFIDAPIISQKDYLLSQLPAGNIIRKVLDAREGAGTKDPQGKSVPLQKNIDIQQFLTGAGLQENTPAKQRAYLMRQRTEAGSRRKKLRDKQGLPPLR